MKKTVAALLVAGLSQVASAGFVDESSNNPFIENPQMRVIGAARFDVPPGFAREVPLHEAISQIVPRNYTLRSRGLERVQATIVSWQGGRAWDHVMRDVLAQVPQLQAEIDTDSKVVTLSSSAAGPANAGGEQPTESASPAEQWLVTHDDLTARGVLQKWVKQAGWQLIWELQVDYPIEAEAAITSQFEVAVETLTKSLQGADVPPKAIIYRGNRVLRVVARGSE